MEQPLSGQVVLLAEDEVIVAIHMEEMLQSVGAEVVLAHDLQTALHLASRDDISAGVLDFRLGPDTAEPLFRGLDARGVPYIILTGDPGQVHGGRPTLSKPIDDRKLIASLVSEIAKR